MGLSLEGGESPLSATDLRHRLSHGPLVWAWVDAPRTPWVEEGDAVGIVPASPGATGLPVVEEAGLAVVGPPGDRRPVLGLVRELCRRKRCWSLVDAPGSVVIASRSLRAWKLLDAAWRVVDPIARLVEQLRPSPTPEEANRIQARFYGVPEIVADCMQHANGGLSKVEEELVTRWMRPGDRVLDLGCGTGREAVGFAQRGLHVRGLDASSEAIETARRGTRAGIPAGIEVSFETASLPNLDESEESFDVAFVSSDVYAGIPGRSNRVAALERLRAAVRPEGVVIVPADIGGRRVGRLFIDAPRAVGRAFGLAWPEPGDRWVLRSPPPTLLFRHGFAREAEVIEELDAAGLDYAARLSSYVVAIRAEVRPSSVAARRSSLARELTRVVAAFPQVERARRSLGPAPLVALMRRHATGKERRDPLSRARLREAIAICDRLVPFGGGCYRRSLLEMALDAGAAAEPLFLGLRGQDGHAWLESSGPTEGFEFTIAI